MAGLTAADLGSGQGAGAQIFHNIIQTSHGALGRVQLDRCIMIDRSPELLALALERAAALGIESIGYVFDLDSGEGTTPPADVADVVVLAYVLTHLADAANGLRHAARIARDSAVIIVVDADYAAARAEGDAALIRTVDEIRMRLRHGFEDLDDIAHGVGLRRLTGLDDVKQRFGDGELNPKYDALGFVGLFDTDDPARIAWNQIRGGTLCLRQIRRCYVKDAPWAGTDGTS